MKNPLRTIINLSIFLFFLLLVSYVALNIWNIYEQNEQRKQLFSLLTTQVNTLSFTAWEFFKPFLQIVIILTIVDWILSRWGFSLKSKDSKFDWNIQSIIALIVIGSFAIAALGGLSEGVGTLKDLALVVIGFYFGSQKKSVELQTENGKTTIVEEHENEMNSQSKKAPESEQGNTG